MRFASSVVIQVKSRVSPCAATAFCRSATPLCSQNCSMNLVPPTRIICADSRSVASGKSRSAM